MATIGSSYANLADLARTSAAQKGVAPVIEMLSQYNPIVKDASVTQCNDGGQHLTTIRTGLPSVTWRKLYEGVQPDKGEVAQVKDATGMLEGWSETDEKLVKIAKNPRVFRMIEAKAQIQAMTNEVEETIFYGDTATAASEFTGLEPRFNSLTAGTGSQIINGQGAGSTNTSIWFVTWGDQHTQLLYPEGTAAGLKHKDHGSQTVNAANGGRLRVMQDQFMWDVGLTVRDYRGIARICNIDVTDLLRDPSGGGAYLMDLMIDALYTLQNPGQAGGKTVIYANRTILKFLHKQALNDATGNLTVDNASGHPITSFQGMPIHRADALLDTEAAVS